MKVIECTPSEYERNYRKYQGKMDSLSRRNHIPNSRGAGGHVQFMVTIDGVKTAFFINRQKYPNYIGVF